MVTIKTVGEQCFMGHDDTLPQILYVLLVVLFLKIAFDIVDKQVFYCYVPCLFKSYDVANFFLHISHS